MPMVAVYVLSVMSVSPVLFATSVLSVSLVLSVTLVLFVTFDPLAGRKTNFKIILD